MSESYQDIGKGALIILVIFLGCLVFVFLIPIKGTGYASGFFFMMFLYILKFAAFIGIIVTFFMLIVGIPVRLVKKYRNSKKAY
jgi:hypothetical protein